MKNLLSLDLSIVFIIILLYIFIRILINTKYQHTRVVKELFLLGFVISILIILTLNISTLLEKILIFIPLGFFTFYCFEKSLKDTLLICFFMTIILQIIFFLNPVKVVHINDIIFNIIGGLIGIYISNRLIEKTQLRFS